MPEKRLIVTRADDKISQLCSITHPILKRYAIKCKADFQIISESGNIHPHYRILKLYNLFNNYDRIAVIDSDVLILRSCPDIFETVPESKIGSIFEDKGSRKFHRRSLLKDIQKKFVNVGIKEGYINTGVCVFSKLHKDVFKYTEGQDLWLDFGQDDVYLRMMIAVHKFDIHELDIRWNFMSMFEESWSNKSRFDAFIIHYAGNGFFPTIDRFEQLKQDYILLDRYKRLI